METTETKTKRSRVHYIDNLRWITVSLLIVYHAAIAYNTWGEANYIFFGEVKPIAMIVTLISPWFMPLMFLLAGVSSRYSLQKRGFGRFMRERALRLGIPFLFGILCIAPILSYIADVTHNGYEGGFLSHYGVFFTRLTDLTGYDGGFTMGHFWFIGVLIIVSLIACGVIKLCGETGENKKKAAVLGVLLSAAAIASFDVRFFGKQIITYLCVYLLGYYFLGSKGTAERIAKYKAVLTTVFIVSSAADAYLFIYTKGHDTLNTVCSYIAFASGIMALIALGREHLDRSNALTEFCSRISYVFYIVHFPIVILCQYLLYLAELSRGANFVLTLVISYPLTVGLCCLIEKSRYIRLLFGLRIRKRQ